MTHRPLLLLAGILAVLVAAAPPVRAADLPPDLALVPTEAAVFVHVRVGDALRSDHLKEVRDLIRRAGPKALETLSKRFTPDPMTLDRVTVFMFAPSEGPPQPVVIFRMSKPFDVAALPKALLPGAETVTIGGARYVRDERKDMALRVIDNQTFLICPVETAARAAAPPRRDGALAPAVDLAAGNKALVIALNVPALPPQALADIPPELRSLTQARLATLSMDLAAAPKVEARLRFPDGQSAAAAVQTVRGLVQMGQGALTMARGEMEARLNGTGGPAGLEDLPEALASVLGLGLIDRAEEILKNLPLKHEGTELSLEVAVPTGLGANLAVGGAAVSALLLPAVQKVREAAARTAGQNNLKQIALAMHNYHDANNAFPAHAIYSKDGRRPLLSWRVAILPYIEQQALYNQFKLDEPWDSEHNKKLIPIMPKIYSAPGAPLPPEPGLTHYRVFVGLGAGFERRPAGTRLQEIADGTSNTIMAVESNDPVTWTKPDDAAYDPGQPLPKMTPIYPGGLNVAMFDGSVRMLSPKLDEKMWRALITRVGGEVINLGNVDRPPAPPPLIPAVQQVREPDARTAGQNNLKQIGLAMHNYHAANGAFPPHAIYSKDGQRPLLSWRVAILPYVEQDALYRQFKLDEPWDSEHNKKLIPLMPKTYAAPGAPPAREPGLTHYRVFLGLGAGFELRARGTRIADIADGSSNTLLAIESDDPVVWTKPDDATYDPGQPLPKMTPIYRDGLNVAFFDGSVRMLSPKLDEKTWRALITRAGGEVINLGNLDK